MFFCEDRASLKSPVIRKYVKSSAYSVCVVILTSTIEIRRQTKYQANNALSEARHFTVT